MFKKLSRISLSLAVLAAAFVAAPLPQAIAQTYGTITLPVATGWGASVATNVNSVIDMRYNRNLGIYLQAAGDNTTTETVKAHFITGLTGGTNYNSTKAGFDLILTLSNFSTQAITTNWDFGAVGFVQLQYLTNVSGVNLSNVLVQVSLKPGN